mgnify:CR=1 FL=1
MEWLFILFFIWFILNRFLPVKGVTNIDTEEAKKRLKHSTIQGIDVRTPGEYQAYHSNYFSNIPLSELSQRTKELNPDNEVMVICHSGMRSKKAAKLLKKKGFQKITNVKDGMTAWR